MLIILIITSPNKYLLANLGLDEKQLQTQYCLLDQGIDNPYLNNISSLTKLQVQKMVGLQQKFCLFNKQNLSSVENGAEVRIQILQVRNKPI